MRSSSGDPASRSSFSSVTGGGFVMPETPFTYESVSPITPSTQLPQMPAQGQPMPMHQQQSGFPGNMGGGNPHGRGGHISGNATPQTFEILGITHSHPFDTAAPRMQGNESAFTDFLNSFIAPGSSGGGHAGGHISNNYGALGPGGFGEADSGAFFGLPLSADLNEEWAAYLPQAFLSPPTSMKTPYGDNHMAFETQSPVTGMSPEGNQPTIGSSSYNSSSQVDVTLPGVEPSSSSNN